MKAPITPHADSNPMKTNSLLPAVLTAILFLLAFTKLPVSAQDTWTGGGGTDQNWSTAANWNGGVPTSSSAVLFGNGDTEATQGVVNNVVDSLFGGSVLSLQYGNQTGFHTTLINPGQTLTCLGDFITGTETAYTNTAVVITVTGSGGALAVDNSAANILVRQGGANASSRVTLDLSGLDTFTASVNRMYIGRADPPGYPNINRNTGYLYLAKTNRLALASATATPGSTAIEIGRSGSNNGNGSRLYLGQTNEIYASGLGVAFEKETGCQMLFNPIFLNPSLYLRGADGTNRMALWTIGDGEANSGTTSCNGSCDFTGGTVNALVDLMTVGRSSNTGSSGNSRGTLTLAGGLLDVNTLQVGLQTSASGKNGTGTANVNGGTLRVQNDLELAHVTGGAGAAITVGTLNIDGGTVEVAGDLLEVGGAGTSTLNVNSGTLDLQPAGDSTPGNIVVDTLALGSTGTAVITNAASITAPQITVSFGGTIAGAPTIDIGSAGFLDVSGVAGFTVAGTLQGAGTVSGDLVQAPGASIIPGGNGTVGTLNLSGLTLNKDGTLQYDLSSSAAGLNDQLIASGSLVLAGTNNVVLTALDGDFDTAMPYTLISYFGGLTGDATYFQVTGVVAQSRRTFTFDTTSTPNAVTMSVGGSAPVGLTWVGDGTANLWDINGALNWNNGTGADKFFNLDQVTFNDSGSASPAVSLSGNLVPGSLTVSNDTKNYTFSGSGGLTGKVPLSKQGAGSLTIANSAGNDFGAITIDAGSVTIANGAADTFAGDLALNAGTLTLNLAGDTTISTVISGTNGALVKQDTNSLTLAGASSAFDGTILANAGTLVLANSAALGSAVGGTTIASGATLDIHDNTVNVGTEPISVSGQGVGLQGAIVNASGNNNFVGPNLAFVTLLGDTTFGGTGRWDLRAAAGTGADPATGGLSTGGHAYNLTKLGTNTVNLVSLTIDTSLADIDVKEGLLSFEGNITSAGNPTNTLTVDSGATLRFWAITNRFDKVIKLQDGATILNGSGANTVIGPVELQGSNTFDIGGTSLTLAGNISGVGGLTEVNTHTLILSGLNNTFSGGLLIAAGTLQVGDGGPNGSLPAIPATNNGALVFNSASDLALTVPVSGTGTLAQAGSGKLTISGSQNYSGASTVSAGTLQVDGSLLGGGGVTVSGGTLAGVGTIVGTVTVQAGGTLAPGDSTGTLNVVGALSLAGTNRMQLNKSGSTLDNDKLAGISSLTLGGTLVLEISGDALAAGDQFQLYSATLILPGTFASIEPAQPGPGLLWDTSALNTSGILRVVAAAPSSPVISGFQVFGADLVLSGTNGTANADYYVLTSTNLVGTWSALATNSFDGSGNFNFTNTVNTSEPQRFYRLQVP